MHASCLFVFFIPFKIELLIHFYCLLFKCFTLTAGFHRYFSHSLKHSFFQFILAFLAIMAAQKDPLWWASHHRHHAHGY